MSTKRKKHPTLSPSHFLMTPKKAHQIVMKSSLRKAIELKKLENQPSMHKYSSSISLKHYLTKESTMLSLETTPTPKNDASEDVSSPFNSKAMKNLQFLPFLHERNGMGKIIDCGSETPLKKHSVPSILQTQRILKNIQIKQDTTKIDIDDTLEKELNFENEVNSGYHSTKNSTTKHILQQYRTPLNLEKLNDSKFLDVQQKPYNSVTPRCDQSSINSIKFIAKNSNHQIAFSNFRVTKEKNFVLMNQANPNQLEKPKISLPTKQPINASGGQMKLRNPSTIFSNNQPCLGTYEPNMNVVHTKSSVLIPFANMSPKASILLHVSTPQPKEAPDHRRSRTYTTLQDQLLSQQASIEKKEEVIVPRLRRQASQGGKGQVFQTGLPQIPLNRVFEERAKIKTMIMDIKTNIYKMDKY